MKIGELIRDNWWAKLALSALIIVLVILSIDKIIMPIYVDLGDETELPDIIEMPLSEATKVLEGKGFKIVVKDSLFDAKHDVGTVIEQNPYPYATVKEGRRVYLTVSIGEKPIIMPNLFGVSPREAELILDTYGLLVGSKYYVPNDRYYEGTVMGQSYPQGQEIKSSSKIDIIISLGQVSKDLIAPDLVGKSLHEARERLKAVNLNIAEIIWEERDSILPETVLSQSIPAGQTFEQEETIILSVSKEMIPESDTENSKNE
jgi:beta-lactam-binding protein with PASTA domain